VSYKNSFNCTGTSADKQVTLTTCIGPPPVGDGVHGALASFTKGSDFETNGTIDVTYEHTLCSSSRTAILYNSIGTWSGYAATVGCALPNGGSGGSASFSSTGQTDVWYNIIWVSSTNIGGHPGMAYDGTSEVERNWPAAGLCSVASDLQNDDECD